MNQEEINTTSNIVQDVEDEQTILKPTTKKRVLKPKTEEQKQKMREAVHRYQAKNKDKIKLKNKEYNEKLSEDRKQVRLEYSCQIRKYQQECSHMLERFFKNEELVITPQLIEHARQLLNTKPYIKNINTTTITHRLNNQTTDHNQDNENDNDINANA